MTRSRSVWPRAGGRLDNIENSTAENWGRLENIEDMLGHLQNVLDDISKPTKTLTSRTVTRGSLTVRLPLAVACQISDG